MLVGIISLKKINDFFGLESYLMKSDFDTMLTCFYFLAYYSYYFFNLCAVVTGFETENKYLVRNTLGQQVYFAAESKFNPTLLTLQNRNSLCNMV